MLKKIAFLVFGVCLVFSCLGEMSETKRGTFDGIEWLYTVDYEAGKVVLEKAILLTSESYDMELDINGMLYQIFHANGYGVDYRDFKECDVLIGASAFEGNDYLSKICIFVSSMMDAPIINLSIGEKAFKGCSNFDVLGFDGEINKIFIRDIGASAFEECATNDECCDFNFSLGGVDSSCVFTCLTNIGERAFCSVGSSGYLYINFSETLVSIGKEAFKECALQLDLSLPSTIVEIQESTFEGCFGAFSFKKGLKRIGLNAFKNCVFFNSEFNGGDSSYLGDVNLPDGLERVEDSAFEGAEYEKLVLPNTLKYIGYSAFSDGYTKGTVHIPQSVEFLGVASFCDNPYIESVIVDASIKTLPFGTFMRCIGLQEVTLPNNLEVIEGSAFLDCINLSVIIPASVVKTERGNPATRGNPMCIKFEGLPPKGISESRLLDAKEVWVPEEYKIQWAPYINGNLKFAKKVDGEWVALGGKVISNAMRASDPTIMDIKYKVTSTKDKVNVRILAYKDGVRSFANALPLATFVDGTAANVGDGVAANVEHTVSWQVSKDWDADLAKLSVEVFVMEDNLLPLQLTTIPAMGDKAAVTFSRNEQKSEKVMNALYWLYADKTSDLTLENGVLKSGGKQLVNGTSLSTENALSYIYSKMGYGTLSGDTLKYVNNLMRSSISSGKFAVKEGAAE